MAGNTVKIGTGSDYATYTVLVDPVTGNPVTSIGGGPGGPAAAFTYSVAIRSNAASSTTSAVVLAANPDRKAARILNNSSSIFYGLYGTGTASSSNYSFVLAPLTASPIVPVGLPSYEDIPASWIDPVTGVWAAANGNLLITEFV